MKHLPFLITLLLSQLAFGQSRLPVIRATSPRVAIRDGAFLDKNAWSLSPKLRPDIFTADRTRQPKWVTFYTDIDSIRVRVKPGSASDFVVLLNGNDSCFTRIASAIPASRNVPRAARTHDTIPFVLTSYNAIHVKAIINRRDTVSLHFDVGSFDFRLTREAVLKRTHLLAGQPDALAGTARPDFTKREKIVTLQLGKLVWTNPTVTVTGLTAHEMDGRFGWNLFEGKAVEIDYDKGLLIVHSQRPRGLSGYAKSKLTFIRSFVCIDGTLTVANRPYTGKFLLDTGADKAMILDSTWMARQHVPTDLPLIKRSAVTDPRGVRYETRVVRMPGLTVNGFALTAIPATLLGSKRPLDFDINYLGNDLLKRFNTILDFRTDHIYLKPNSLINLPYRENS
ncbi:hypothetical protein [Fibrella forsythiae]|uniref:Peptidase A2 domain-containing protein n=1 Tax=Fibrella forsythiae TaxID=2817061 RepID=A0ABS3JHA8_9BACT|nr:hypothetical protein [Fibrella forsythiae]MBO0949402.1 hypothetical protein [Fibrella forsythiae]